MTTVRQRIIEAVRGAGPAGMTASEIGLSIGGHRGTSRATIAKLSYTGYLISVGPACRTWYFVEQEFADAHKARLPAILAEITEGVKDRQRARARDTYARKADAENPNRKRAGPRKPRLEKNSPLYVTLKPAHKHKPANIAQIVVPSNVKRTVHPTPPARFAVTGPVANGFASLGVGRYLEAA